MSKILEKLFSEMLVILLDVHNIISASQYGFETNSSTSYAITDAKMKMWKVAYVMERSQTIYKIS